MTEFLSDPRFAGIEPFPSIVWLSSPTMHGDEQRWVDEAIRTNWVSTVGENINEVEKQVAQKVGRKYAVALSSGTAALHLAVRLCAEKLYGLQPVHKGVLEGRRVFASDMTFDATVNPIAYEGGEAVFIDTELDSWNMDPAVLEKAFSIYPDVRLIVIAHLYGTPGKCSEISAIAKKHGALIIEDAAESFGSSYLGKQTGCFGDVSNKIHCINHRPAAENRGDLIMRHHRYNPDFKFIVEPESFNKYTERELLQYCLGATMYMPGFKDFAPKILSNAMPGLTSMVLCCEDACPEEKVLEAEENIHRLLDTVTSAVEEGALDADKVPLIFVRIRNLDQFKHFGASLTKHQVKSLCGINFPKFNAENGYEYYAYLKDLNEKFGEIIYGMPIIEDKEVAYKESRMYELTGIKRILDKYKDLVLQVRVGATDFSSVFGVRRGVGYSVYDIMTVRECLNDILNMFGRDNDYVVSGPVWEYFRAPKELMFEELPHYGIEDYLTRHEPIVNNEIDGLLREVLLDKANGFVGRTVIHPTHVKFVNAMMAVTKEEYDDACQILGTGGGVVKGSGGNKMNEIKPHTNWAKKVYNRARAYGVIRDESGHVKLFAVNE